MRSVRDAILAMCASVAVTNLFWFTKHIKTAGNGERFLAGGSLGSRFSRRKTRVRKFDRSFELIEDLSPKGLKILKALGAGNSQIQAAKMAECSRSTVSYWKDKLVSMGALRFQCRSASSVFSLTPWGSKKITRGEGFVDEAICVEDCAVKFGVLDWGRCDRLVWEKLGEPRNWVKLGCRVGGVRVVRTSESVIIHPGRLKGFSGEDHALVLLAGRIVEWVRQILEGKFGMVLEEEGVPIRREPITRFYSEDAKEDMKYGVVITEGVGSTDASPPERVPHEEYSGLERAHARHLLPDSVRRIESKVDVLTDSLQKVVVSFDKFAGSFEQFIGLFKEVIGHSDGAQDARSVGKGDDYVS